MASNRRRDTGRSSSFTRHFWPGERTLHQTPGSIPPCRRTGTGLLGTPDPAAVTCRSCRKALQRRQLLAFAPRDGGPWPLELLEAAGLRAPGSPLPLPERLPVAMRRPLPHPLETLGDRWRQRASVEFSRRLVDPAAAAVARTLISCAAEVDDYLRNAKGACL